MVEEISLGDRKAIQTLLEQRKEEASFMGWVTQREDKAPAPEKRILVITANRIYAIRTGGKVAREAHWLELTSIQSNSKSESNFTFKQFKFNMTTDLTDEIIRLVRVAYHTAFPGIPEKDRIKLDISPTSRLSELPVVEQPLGGFITTYKSLCTFYPGTEVREDIIWDMENFYAPGNIKDFNLNEFEALSANDMKALLGALQYNTFFKALSAQGSQLDKTMVQAIADTLKVNSAIEELNLKNAGINKDGMTSISEALQANKNITLTSINIAQNNIEDKGMQSFANYIGSMNKGIVKLDISDCGAGKVGMSSLFNSLKKNVHMSSTLTYFDISGNKIESDGSGALSTFLASNNALRVFLLSNTFANCEVVTGAILRGCKELQQLDLSSNKFAKKESFNISQFLQASAVLTNLNLANTGAPVESYKEIISAMIGNVYLKDCYLNLAENKLGLPGARVLGNMADKLSNIASLDLRDNEFGDEGVSNVCDGFCYNTNLKHLSLAANFKGAKKGKNHAIESIIKLIASECPLESLNVSGGKGSELKLEIVPFLYALATNETLKTVDISGHQMGNKGAFCLGKAIQTNDSLESLKWDNNGTTLQGFQSFAIGLSRNHSLKNMTLPINDISAALKGSEAQALSDSISHIERLLSRNQSPSSKFQSVTDGISSGNQMAFLTSGQREAVQKTLLKIKATGRKVGDERRIVLEDAENQDQLMSNLYNIEDQTSQAFEQDLKKEFIAFVKKCSPLFGKLKGGMIEQLVEQVKRYFKSLDEETIRRLQSNLAYGGKELPEEDFEKVLVDSAAVELSNKSSQAFHSTVQIASDYLYEKLQDKLQDILYEFNEAANEDAKKEEDAKLETKSPGQTAQRSGSNVGTPSKTASASSAPTKPQPKVPPKTAKAKPPVPDRSAKPGKKAEEEGDAHVEALPKVESNLNHATKDRPAIQQKRKPPTRKPRPMAPGEKPM